jgi:phosphatidylglycerol:prolipoprotein diacylglycerol transferase
LPGGPLLSAQQWSDLVSLAVVGGIVGARLVYVALHWERFLEAPWEVVAVWHGGLVWYGGLWGGLLGAWGYARRRRIPFLALLDAAAPFVALAHAIGRVGCFFNGCCYGRPTTSWCAVIFPGHAEPVIPTQLIEAAGLLGLFVLLRVLQRPAVLRAPGRLFGGYLTLYAVLRFPLEFLRGDQSPFLGPLTLQQLISIGLVVAGVSLMRTHLPPPRRDENV